MNGPANENNAHAAKEDSMSDYFGKEVPKLGFGLMRLPKTNDKIDVGQVEEMVDLFFLLLQKMRIH